MKNTIIGLLLAGSLTASSAFAVSTVSLTQIAGEHSSNAGAFLAVTSDRGNFKTFCLETNRYLNLGDTYQYTLADAATSGGYGGSVNGQDPLSIASAWLMRQFAMNTLVGYVANNTMATQLQNAFWMLEQENIAWNSSNIFIKQALAFFGTKENAMADANGAYGVKVMNIFTADKAGKILTDNQSQIVFVPEATSTMMIFGAAMGLMAFIFRRRS